MPILMLTVKLVISGLLHIRTVESKTGASNGKHSDLHH